jgi:hypothetical protein
MFFKINGELTMTSMTAPKRQTRTTRGSLVAVGLITTGLSLAFQPLVAYAQDNLQETILPVAPSVLAAIREAPFSELFRLDTPKAGQAYGVKDRDYKGNNNQLGVFTLWADAPEIDLLQVAIRYCLPDEAIAKAKTHLVQVELRSGGQTLVKIDQPAVSTESTLSEVTPAQYVTTTNYSSPFDDPFWSPYDYSTPYYSPAYLPEVNCSLGGSRLDLKPVKGAIAALPNQTLEMRLLFSNGMTSNWQLGQGTVSALKQLPSIQSK